MFSLTNRDPFRRSGAFTDLATPLEWGTLGGRPTDVIDSLLRPVLSAGDFMNDACTQLKCDFFEKENEYILACEMSGVRKEDIDVGIDGNQVTITGTKRVPSCCATEAGASGVQPHPTWEYFIRERQLGKIQRTFKLPTNADCNRAAATNIDGMLCLQFPKIVSSAAHRKLHIDQGV